MVGEEIDETWSGRACVLVKFLPFICVASSTAVPKDGCWIEEAVDESILGVGEAGVDVALARLTSPALGGRKAGP